MTVLNRLRELRYLHDDISQTRLAQELHVSRQTINALENGRYLPSIGLALQLARYFGAPVEKIFWLEEEE